MSCLGNLPSMAIPTQMKNTGEYGTFQICTLVLQPALVCDRIRYAGGQAVLREELRCSKPPIFETPKSHLRIVN
jgi:hypothetical protein